MACYALLNRSFLRIRCSWLFASISGGVASHLRCCGDIWTIVGHHRAARPQKDSPPLQLRQILRYFCFDLTAVSELSSVNCSVPLSLNWERYAHAWGWTCGKAKACSIIDSVHDHVEAWMPESITATSLNFPHSTLTSSKATRVYGDKFCLGAP